MPEFPEVETISRQLHTVLPGKIISSVKILRDKNFIGNPQILIKQKINSVSRFAKIIRIHLCHPCLPEGRLEPISGIYSSKNPFPLIAIHLKMTGQLIFESKDSRIAGGHPNSDFFASLPTKHTRVILEFSDQSKLFFNDQRTFGWLKIINSQTEFDQEFTKLSGIEPFSPQFTWQNLKATLGKSTRAIKLSILDQTKIVGIGNIYANDGLFLAHISPIRQSSSLSDSEWQSLTQNLKKVLIKSIKLGGTSQKDYVHFDGSKGSYQDNFLVYGKKEGNCPICQAKIMSVKLGGRSSFYCPHCQK